MIWNLDTKESVISSPVRTITCHQDVILSMSFNTNGSLLATACKDRKIRILDPRLGTVLQVSAESGSGVEPRSKWRSGMGAKR
jgi:coronin-2